LSGRLTSDKFLQNWLEKRDLCAQLNPASLENYLCIPPVSVQAIVKMRAGWDVPGSQLAYDEF
jgi:Na+-transporting NADH:ubiquinone oxidoreductase subunit NqrF